MTAFWTDPKSATDWAQHDAQRDLLALPRSIAAEIVAVERPNAASVADIGSGPGDFLAVFLGRIPAITGIWSDISEVMAELARPKLADFDGRVSYHLADMTNLAGLPSDLDVIVTSRAVHHLDLEGLRKFYRDAAEHLTPGGWLVNLDHIGAPTAWDARLRQARTTLIPRVTEQGSHHHNYPLTSIDDHLGALEQAGLTDVYIPWRAFVTCLFMARRPAR
jgi:SAM-dependent methyltransferase